MQKLIELAAKVECSVHVSFNNHKDFYEPADTYYRNRDILSAEQIAEIDFDKDIWEVQFYPHTPIGFYYLVGNDLEPLVDEALKIMEEING